MGPDAAFVSFLTVCLFVATSADSPIVYITKQCGKTLNISKQTFVELSPSTRPRLNNTTCRMDLSPVSSKSNDSGLVLTIETIRLSSRTAGACVDNSIDVYDGQQKLNRQSLCGRYSDQYIFVTNSTTHHVMGIKLTSRDLQQRDISLKAVVTPYHNGPCFSDEFQCANGRCISVHLQCNAHNNCGDDSDEANKLCGLLYLSVAAIVGIVLAALAVIICLPCLFIVFCCRNKRRRGAVYQQI